MSEAEKRAWQKAWKNEWDQKTMQRSMREQREQMREELEKDVTIFYIKPNPSRYIAKLKDWLEDTIQVTRKEYLRTIAKSM